MADPTVTREFWGVEVEILYEKGEQLPGHEGWPLFLDYGVVKVTADDEGGGLHVMLGDEYASKAYLFQLTDGDTVTVLGCQDVSSARLKVAPQLSADEVEDIYEISMEDFRGIIEAATLADDYELALEGVGDEPIGEPDTE